MTVLVPPAVGAAIAGVNSEPRTATHSGFSAHASSVERAPARSGVLTGAAGAVTTGAVVNWA